MRYFCELSQPVQNQAKSELKAIIDLMGTTFPMDEFNTIDEYVDELMNEKIINLIGTDYVIDKNGDELNCLLSFEKYKKYLYM